MVRTIPWAWPFLAAPMAATVSISAALSLRVMCPIIGAVHILCVHFATSGPPNATNGRIGGTGSRSVSDNLIDPVTRRRKRHILPLEGND